MEVGQLVGMVGYLPVGYLGHEHEEEAEEDEDEQLVVLVLFGQEGAHLVVWRDLLKVGGSLQASLVKARTVVEATTRAGYLRCSR